MHETFEQHPPHISVSVVAFDPDNCPDLYSKCVIVMRMQACGAEPQQFVAHGRGCALCLGMQYFPLSTPGRSRCKTKTRAVLRITHYYPLNALPLTRDDPLVQDLGLSKNILTRLPAEVGKFKALKRLDMRDNSLVEIDAAVAKLLRNSLSILLLDRNPQLHNPPSSVIKLGPKAVRMYYQESTHYRQNWSLRLFMVGSMGAGKTALCDALQWSRPCKPNKTDGPTPPSPVTRVKPGSSKPMSRQWSTIHKHPLLPVIEEMEVRVPRAVKVKINVGSGQLVAETFIVIRNNKLAFDVPDATGRMVFDLGPRTRVKMMAKAGFYSVLVEAMRFPSDRLGALIDTPAKDISKDEGMVAEREMDKFRILCETEDRAQKWIEVIKADALPLPTNQSTSYGCWYSGEWVVCATIWSKPDDDTGITRMRIVQPKGLPASVTECDFDQREATAASVGDPSRKIIALSRSSRPDGDLNRVLLLREMGRGEWKGFRQLSVFLKDLSGDPSMADCHKIILTGNRLKVVLVVDLSRLHLPGTTKRMCWWLQVIRAKPGAPKVVLVATHADKVPETWLEARKADLLRVVSSCCSGDLADVLVDKRVWTVSCRTMEGIDELRDRLLTLCIKEHVLKQEIPVKYLHLENMVRSLSREQELIDWQSLCQLANRSLHMSEKQMRCAMRYVHDLGTALWFDFVEGAEDVIFLRPEWLIALLMQVKNMPLSNQPPALNNALYELTLGKIALILLPHIWKEHNTIPTAGKDWQTVCCVLELFCHLSIFVDLGARNNVDVSATHRTKVTEMRGERSALSEPVPPLNASQINALLQSPSSAGAKAPNKKSIPVKMGSALFSSASARTVSPGRAKRASPWIFSSSRSMARSDSTYSFRDRLSFASSASSTATATSIPSDAAPEQLVEADTFVGDVRRVHRQDSKWFNRKIARTGLRRLATPNNNRASYFDPHRTVRNGDTVGVVRLEGEFAFVRVLQTKSKQSRGCQGYIHVRHLTDAPDDVVSQYRAPTPSISMSIIDSQKKDILPQKKDVLPDEDVADLEPRDQEHALSDSDLNADNVTTLFGSDHVLMPYCLVPLQRPRPVAHTHGLGAQSRFQLPNDERWRKWYSPPAPSMRMMAVRITMSATESYDPRTLVPDVVCECLSRIQNLRKDVVVLMAQDGIQLQFDDGVELLLLLHMNGGDVVVIDIAVRQPWTPGFEVSVTMIAYCPIGIVFSTRIVKFCSCLAPLPTRH